MAVEAIFPSVKQNNNFQLKEFFCKKIFMQICYNKHRVHIMEPAFYIIYGCSKYYYLR